MRIAGLMYLLFLLDSLVLAQLPAVNKAIVPASQCSSSTSALTQIAQNWKDGYNNGDASGVAALYAEDAYYLTQHYVTGIVQGRPAIEAYVQNGIDAHYRIDSIEVLKVDCVGDFAYAITRYNATNGGQKAVGLNIVVMKKSADRWMIVAHESAVPDPKTAIQQLKIQQK